MGNGHIKILKEFLNIKKKSSYDLEIEKNLHSLDVIHSVYNNVKNKIYVKIESKQSKLGL